MFKSLNKVEFKTSYDEQNGLESLIVMCHFGENEFFSDAVLTKTMVQVADE